MKTMKIEKELSLAHAVKELQRISVREGLQYKKEEDGIRAIGRSMCWAVIWICRIERRPSGR